MICYGIFCGGQLQWDQEIHTKKRESDLNLYYAMLIFSSVTLVSSECSCDNLRIDSITLKSFFFFTLIFRLLSLAN